mgnify:CR=1 FL=1|jgi:hypothetical protein
MLPNNPAFTPEEQKDERMLTIDGHRLFTERMCLEDKWGLDKAVINEMCLFRVDLPCYPSIWDEPLFLEVELLVMVDAVE